MAGWFVIEKYERNSSIFYQGFPGIPVNPTHEQTAEKVSK